MRGPSCQLSLETSNIRAALARVQIRTPSYPFVQFKFSVYGLTYVPDIHIRTRDLQCSHTSVGLAQARPNKIKCCYDN